MHQLAQNLFIGSRFELARIRTQSEYAVVHASHEAHKHLLGYRHGAPKNAEYYIARRQNHLYVNIITQDNPTFYHQSLFEDSARFIHEQRSAERDVYIYSEQGGNRPSGIALVYLANERLIPHESFEAALTEFHKLYPYTRLVGGLYLHIRHHWETYIELLQKPNIVNQ
jgi:hypothetical protein